MGVQACPREFRNKAGRLGSEGENSFPCFGRGGGGGLESGRTGFKISRFVARALGESFYPGLPLRRLGLGLLLKDPFQSRWA